MKKFDIYKYEVEKGLSYPIIIYFYFRHTGERIGFIELYKNGKCYTDLFQTGMNIKVIRKMLRIACKEKIKIAIKTFVYWKILKK